MRLQWLQYVLYCTVRVYNMYCTVLSEYRVGRFERVMAVTQLQALAVGTEQPVKRPAL